MRLGKEVCDVKIRKPDPVSGWIRAFQRLFRKCNSVRDIGGVEKEMGGWKQEDKTKIVNQIEYIEDIFADWKAYLDSANRRP